MNAVVKLPDVHQSFYEARKVLRAPFADTEQISAALDVLEYSHEWTDIQLCRQMRGATKATRMITDEELIEIGFPPLKSQAEIDDESPSGLTAPLIAIAALCVFAALLIG